MGVRLRRFKPRRAQAMSECNGTFGKGVPCRVARGAERYLDAGNTTMNTKDPALGIDGALMMRKRRLECHKIAWTPRMNLPFFLFLAEHSLNCKI